MSGGLGGIAGSIIGGIFTGGAGPAIGAGIGAAIPTIADIAKDIARHLVPDPTKQAEVQAAIEAALTQREAAVIAATQQMNSEQSAINLAETQKEGWFSSAWRPTAAWVCVGAFAFQYLFSPAMTWVGSIIGAVLGIAFPVPPSLQMGDLMPVLLGLLGLGGLRTVERVQGVSSPSPAAHNPAIPRRVGA